MVPRSVWPSSSHRVSMAYQYLPGTEVTWYVGPTTTTSVPVVPLKVPGTTPIYVKIFWHATTLL